MSATSKTNTKTKTHTKTNTKTKTKTKCPKDPSHAIFLKSWEFKDIKTDITKYLMHKYTNTNTQIHKYSIFQSARKTQHVVYF